MDESTVNHLRTLRRSLAEMLRTLVEEYGQQNEGSRAAYKIWEDNHRKEAELENQVESLSKAIQAIDRVGRFEEDE